MLQFSYRPQLRMPPPGFPPVYGGLQMPPTPPQHMLHQQQQQMQQSGGGGMMQPGDVGFDGKMLRKAMARKTVDFNPSAARYLEVRGLFIQRNNKIALKNCF